MESLCIADLRCNNQLILNIIVRSQRSKADTIKCKCTVVTVGALSSSYLTGGEMKFVGIKAQYLRLNIWLGLGINKTLITYVAIKHTVRTINTFRF